MWPLLDVTKLGMYFFWKNFDHRFYFKIFDRAAEEAKEAGIKRFLDRCAAPRKWKAKGGKWVEMINWTGEPGKFEMDTGYTLRAKELRDLYQ